VKDNRHAPLSDTDASLASRSWPALGDWLSGKSMITLLYLSFSLLDRASSPVRIEVIADCNNRQLYSDSDFFQRIAGKTLKILVKSGKPDDRPIVVSPYDKEVMA
jgi:hypothetical protein